MLGQRARALFDHRAHAVSAARHLGEQLTQLMHALRRGGHQRGELLDVEAGGLAGRRQLLGGGAGLLLCAAVLVLVGGEARVRHRQLCLRGGRERAAALLVPRQRRLQLGELASVALPGAHGETQIFEHAAKLRVGLLPAHAEGLEARGQGHQQLGASGALLGGGARGLGALVFERLALLVQLGQVVLDVLEVMALGQDQRLRLRGGLGQGVHLAPFIPRPLQRAARACQVVLDQRLGRGGGGLGDQGQLAELQERGAPALRGGPLRLVGGGALRGDGVQRGLVRADLGLGLGARGGGAGAALAQLAHRGLLLDDELVERAAACPRMLQRAAQRAWISADQAGAGVGQARRGGQAGERGLRLGQRAELALVLHVERGQRVLRSGDGGVRRLLALRQLAGRRCGGARCRQHLAQELGLLQATLRRFDRARRLVQRGALLVAGASGTAGDGGAALGFIMGVASALPVLLQEGAARRQALGLFGQSQGGALERRGGLPELGLALLHGQDLRPRRGRDAGQGPPGTRLSLIHI